MLALHRQPGFNLPAPHIVSQAPSGILGINPKHWARSKPRAIWGVATKLPLQINKNKKISTLFPTEVLASLFAYQF